MLNKKIQTLFFCLITISSSAQLTFNSFKYAEKQGLFTYNIKSIAQDKYGFIWLGTQEGLYFFNGVEFKLLSNNASANTTKDVKQIVYDSVFNWIWVAYYSGGLEAYDCNDHQLKKRILSGSDNKGTPLENINFFLFSNHHEIIIALPDAVISYVPDINSPLDKVSKKNIIKSENISRLFSFNDKMLAVVFKKGLFYYDVNLKKTGACIYSDTTDQTVAYFNDKCYYFIAGHQIIQYNSDTKKKAAIDISFNVEAINKWKENEVLLSASAGNSIASFINNSLQPINFYTGGKPDNNDYVITSMWDKDNNLWLGNSKSLQSSYLKKPYILSYSNTTKELAPINHLYQVLQISDNELLLGDLKGCYYFNKKNNYLQPINTTDNTFLLRMDDEGNIFYSNKKGLNIINRNGLKVLPIEKEFSEWKNFAQYSYLDEVDVTNNISIFSSNKDFLILWDKAQKKCIEIKADFIKGQIDNSVFSLKKIDTNKIIICQSDGIVLYDFIKGQARAYKFNHPVTNEKITNYFDALRVGDEIWLATYGFGILVLDKNFKLKQIIKQLSNNGVYKLYNDSLGYVWASTNKGLDRINIKTKSISFYTTEDGLHNNMFEQYCGYQYGNSIYFGGINGFTEIIAKDIEELTAKPSVYIFKVGLINSKSIEFFSNISTSKIIIPDDVVQSNIYLCSNNLVNNKNNFFYKISGINDWLTLGSDNKISILGLSPGEYKLGIKTVNADNNLSDEKEILLIISPKWYQTWWFKLVIFLIGVSIIYAIYLNRISQIKKQHEIRKNIATDLHDDLGSTLNSVKIFTNLAISGIKQQESLQQVKDNLNEATTGLRDMIWVLDDSLDTVDELVTRLKQYALPVAGASNIEANVKADSEINNRKLTKDEKRNLFLVCKEAFNNSIKYAEASQINIVITASGKKIQITIKDNGKGFDETRIKKGYGLNNMQYRAGQIKYKVSVQSSPGNGTKITIQPF